jgi:HEAT repeat protein
LIAIGEPSVPALIKVLQGTNSKQKIQVCAVLESLGRTAADAVPALTAAAKDPDKPVSQAADRALKKVRGR